MEYRKDKPESTLKEVVDQISKEPESGDLGFWKEYAFWVLRAVPLVTFIVVLLNYEWPDGLSATIEKLGRRDLAVVTVFSLIGPALFVGGSYIWMWGHDILERTKRK